MTQDRFPRGKTAIVGAATYGMGESPGLSSIDLAVSASVRALDQAGLAPSDVDGLFIGLPDDFLSGLTLAEYLGIQPKVTDNLPRLANVEALRCLFPTQLRLAQSSHHRTSSSVSGLAAPRFSAVR